MSLESRFDGLKRYVRFDAEDAALFRSFGDAAAPEFPRIAREFYDRIREHEPAHDVFTGEEQIQRLQRSLVQWMGRVYDESYYEETATHRIVTDHGGSIDVMSRPGKTVFRVALPIGPREGF